MIRRPPRSTLSSSSAASDVYKRQVQQNWEVAPRLVVLDSQLMGREWMCGDEAPGLADWSVWPWVHNLLSQPDMAHTLQIQKYRCISAWADRMVQIPAVTRACDRLKVPYPIRSAPPERPAMGPPGLAARLTPHHGLRGFVPRHDFPNGYAQPPGPQHSHMANHQVLSPKPFPLR
eukprot:TRINITY_DN37225_c0_g1_i2.p2 TRINITY_DN37225_c0_g1~~TRINITY_DN37225_c0_g1_i2.p2  ORF type:complete len:175 (+),score=19.06 TRINITY_DN37225_c0_g1_i2:146-670(+)